MTDHDRYFEYLKGRSRAAVWYRRGYLYPRLGRYLNGLALDVGCGVGDMLAFRPRTIGVDVNPKTVEYCIRRGFPAVCMGPDRLPFLASSFDSAVADNVLEHLASPRALLTEVRRVLKDGGTLVVGVPGERGYQADPDHKTFYDEPRLTAEVEHAGFQRAAVFHVPWRSRRLSAALRQYCIYAAFRAA